MISRKCCACKKAGEHRATWGDFYCVKHWGEQRLYENGLPFSTKIKENVDDLVGRIKARKASMMIIDGSQGEGKTTLAVHLADYVTGNAVRFDDVLAMGGTEFSKKIRLAYTHGYVVVIYDESGDFNKRGALTRLNALINRVFETFRALKILVILCLPSFSVLDNSLFDKGIPRLLLHCEGRTEVDGDIRGYSLYRMFYLREKMKKATVPPQVYGWVHPNFFGHFLDLSPERATELDVYSTAGKLAVLDLAEIHSEGLQTYHQISTKLNRSVRWVQIKLRELGVEARKVHEQKKYFAPEVIDILVQHLDGGPD
jgi:hypothetical protein